MQEATETFFGASKELNELLLSHNKQVILREHQLEVREKELGEKEVRTNKCRLSRAKMFSEIIGDPG